MADLNEIRQVLVETLPKTGGSGNSISVGFSNSTDIEVLMTGLAKLWDRKERERLAGLNKSLKDNQAVEAKENGNFLGKLSTFFKNGVSDYLKQREDKDEKLSKSIAISITDSLTKFFKSYVNSAEKLGSFFQNIDRSGVVLSGGLNQLKESAIELGMTQNDLLNTIKKTSPLLARLSGSGKDSLATFTRTVSSVNADMLLTNDERVAAFENVMNRLTPTDLQIISQERLNAEIKKTAQNLKEMSYMTGKNVESLAEEQKIRDLNTRIGAMRQQERYKGTFDTLIPMGFSESQIMALITGGLDATLSDKDRMWLLRPDIQALSMAVRSGKIKSSSDALNWKNENMALIQNADRRRSYYANNPTYTLAAGANADLDYMMFFNNPFLNLGSKEPKYSEEDKDTLKKSIDVKRAKNSKDFLLEWAKAGGVKGVNTALTLETAYYTYASDALGKIVSYLGSYTPILIGMSQGISNIAIKWFTDSVSGQLSNSWKYGSIALGAGIGIAGLVKILGESHQGKSYTESMQEGGLYGAVSGAIIGQTIGGIRGLCTGAIIGASFGAITALGKNIYENGFNTESLWNSANELLDLATKNAWVGGIVGAVIGETVGGPLGALIGGAFGAGVGWWRSDNKIKNTNNKIKQYNQPQIAQPENISQQINNQRLNTKVSEGTPVAASTNSMTIQTELMKQIADNTKDTYKTVSIGNQINNEAILYNKLQSSFD